MSSYIHYSFVALHDHEATKLGYTHTHTQKEKKHHFEKRSSSTNIYGTYGGTHVNLSTLLSSNQLLVYTVIKKLKFVKTILSCSLLLIVIISLNSYYN